MTRELSPSEAAERIGTTTRTVQRWITTRRLPARRVGGRWRVAIDAIDAFRAGEGGAAAAAAPEWRRIERLFVANRGEIAARIGRTCDRLGIAAILPPTEGSEALNLLDIEAVVAAAVATAAHAVHPGFGFLAENADFAKAVAAAGLIWIGPPPQAIRTMGDKAAARRLAASLGIPIVPGYDGADQTDAALKRAARRIGYPLLVKPAAGGGGKGMRVVRDGKELGGQIQAARREAKASFGDEHLILERLIEGPRHVEVQLLFDGHGNGVHLGERDCSVQRRHQKVLEETPSPAVRPAVRRHLTDAALALGRAVGYVGAGTCEFLLTDDGSIFFLEMNTRLQVEHPVTELVTGRDLVADQIRIAAGEALGFGQRDVRPSGHAVEVRLYAEDAESGYLPATDRIAELRWPAGDGIRVDAGVVEGDVVGGRFDPMLAKIVAGGRNRREALARMAGALDETVVLGLTTNLRFLRWLVRRPEVLRGQARIDTLEAIWRPGEAEAAVPQTTDAAWRAAARELGGGGWRLNGPGRARLIADDGTERWVAAAEDPGLPPVAAARDGETVHVDVEGRSVGFRVAPPPDVDRAAAEAAAHATGRAAANVDAPMPGAVIAVHVRPDATVVGGDPIVTLEAMKMEHVVPAPGPGRVTELSAAVGDQVTRGAVLARIEP
jgi:excisionase family DNA binding protein